MFNIRGKCAGLESGSHLVIQVLQSYGEMPANHFESG